MTHKRFAQTLVGILTTVLFLAGTNALPLNAAPGQRLNPLSPARPPTLNVNGEYTGIVTLQGVYAGTYTNTNITPSSSDLGQIDLALNLTQSGTSVSGYVAISHTLVFSQTGNVPNMGPSVSGTFNGSSLTLTSQAFSQVVAGRTVTRTFNLVTSAVSDTGNNLTGTYRETIWGFASQPTTAVGTFKLTRLLNPSILPPSKLYLPVTVRKKR